MPAPGKSFEVTFYRAEKEILGMTIGGGAPLFPCIYVVQVSFLSSGFFLCVTTACHPWPMQHACLCVCERERQWGGGGGGGVVLYMC